MQKINLTCVLGLTDWYFRDIVQYNKSVQVKKEKVFMANKFV